MSAGTRPYRPTPRDVQIHLLKRKHGLSEPSARLLAGLVWGGEH